jgi:hypothetical protein
LKPFLHCSNSQVFDFKRNIWESFINFDNVKEKLIGQTKADVVVQLLVVREVQFKSAELSSTLSNVYISTEHKKMFYMQLNSLEFFFSNLHFNYSF